MSRVIACIDGAQLATAAFTISETQVRQHRVPKRLPKPDGYTLTRPATWR